jgi:protein ImuB
VRPALPTNDRQVWIRLLHLDLEAHPPGAAILSLRLSAEPGHISKVQLGLFSPQLPDAIRLDVTLARIRAIVGEESVGSPILKDSHRPDAFQMTPFAVPTGQAATSARNRPLTAMRQLRPAEDVSVTLRDHRPVSFFFRQRRYDVERAYGPWLASGEWWGNFRWGLQQWDLIAHSGDGQLLCGCAIRDLTQNCWQMAALYD